MAIHIKKSRRGIFTEAAERAVYMLPRNSYPYRERQGEFKEPQLIGG